MLILYGEMLVHCTQYQDRLVMLGHEKKTNRADEDDEDDEEKEEEEVEGKNPMKYYKKETDHRRDREITFVFLRLEYFYVVLAFSVLF